MVTVLACSVDWLRVTRQSATSRAALNVTMAMPPAGGAWLNSGGYMGYEHSLKFSKAHATLAWSERAGQGQMIDLSGSYLALCYAEGQTPEGMIQSTVGKATRIDIAIDIIGENLSVVDLAGEVKRKGVKQKLVVNARSGKAETFYIGSRSSETFTRVYDKGVQTGERVAGEWIRIEFECKAGVARWVYEQLLTGTCQVVAASLLTKIFALNTVGESIMKQLGENAMEVVVERRKETDTELWLLNTVAKTVARATKGNDEFWEKFVEAVQRYWETL